MLATKNLTKVQMINMKAGSVAMKDSIGIKPFIAVAAAQLEDVDPETGEERLYNYIVDSDNNVYAGNSAVVSKVMSDLVDIIDDGDTVHVTFGEIPTKSGRTAVRLFIS